MNLVLFTYALKNLNSLYTLKLNLNNNYLGFNLANLRTILEYLKNTPSLLSHFELNIL